MRITQIAAYQVNLPLREGSYITVSTAEGAPIREHGTMAASAEPGLGVRPRAEVLGKPLVEIA